MQVILKWKSEFGSQEWNFPFRFAIKAPSREEDEATTSDIDTENTLELLGFPDNAVHGWKITPLRTPSVVSDVCVCAWERWE